MKYKWAIIGTGNIASQMAEALAVIPEAELIAVLSRTKENARVFAEKYNIPHIYTERELFAQSDLFDIVYVATPHTQHFDDTNLCLLHKKHVLCEKPMCLNANQSAVLYELAKAQGCFLMEAMWTRFFPAIIKAKALIEEGKIGAVKQVKADFCFKGPYNAEGRHLNKELAGGALLDVGIYPIYFSQIILEQKPILIQGAAHIGKTGVDEQSAYLLQYDNGIIANLSSAVQTNTIQDAFVYGDEGYIHIPKFWQPDSFTLVKKGKEEVFEFERLGNGYTYEVLEVHKCIEQNMFFSEILTPEKSIEVMAIMDEIRKDWGVVYPGE